jgi:hypothetical protein
MVLRRASSSSISEISWGIFMPQMIHRTGIFASLKDHALFISSTKQRTNSFGEALSRVPLAFDSRPI